jgi:hypothetical protein
MREGYFKLFVDTRMPLSKLVGLVKDRTGGTADGDSVDCEWGTFYLDRNDEYSFWKKLWKKHHPDAFLYYRYIIAVELRDFETNRDQYIRRLRDLIATLRATSASVVPACDFEDELN